MEDTSKYDDLKRSGEFRYIETFHMNNSGDDHVDGIEFDTNIHAVSCMRRWTGVCKFGDDFISRPVKKAFH